ncbi:MAG TPA: hypothetical protein PKE04_07275 [Clostridia bacterium]|nr:hypothetical protein [Clostridia bacterium]
MTLQEAHRAVADRLSRLSFETIWTGFAPAPFALYDEGTVCLAGREMPRDNAFWGCTAIEYEGELLAIWHLEEDPVQDLDVLAANLVHEMFHVHQLRREERRFPNELDALRAPEDPAYHQDRYREAWSLRRAWDALRADRPDLARQCLRTLSEQRLRRQAREGAAMRYELYAETFEGSAEYCGLRALGMLAPDRYERRIDRDLDWLTQPEHLLDRRRFAYFFGALSMLLLEALGIGFDKTVGGETLFWEDASRRLRGEDPADGLEAVCNALDERARTQAALLAAAADSSRSSEEGDFRLAGFDPMNWFAKGERVYHKVFVKLMDASTKRELFLHGPAVTWHDPKDLFRVRRYAAAAQEPR